MRTQLLCTFTNVDTVFGTIKIIKKTYEDNEIQISTFSYLSDPINIVCIYNVLDKSKRIKDTISINKKKETTTYYSINALNALIMALNNEVLDKSYRINWTEYTNSLLLSNGQTGYRHIQIQSLENF